jgi:nucleotide-binding universal stress UspA family protein
MRKILIAIDYHPTAEKVAIYGHTIAKALGGNVVLLHVLADPFYYSSSVYDPIMGFGGYSDLSMTPISITDELEQSTHQYLNKIKIFLEDDEIKTYVKTGNCADMIIETATELQAEMIVMGSHSQKWLEHLMIGSVTQNVLQHIKLPLYIIPTKK